MKNFEKVQQAILISNATNQLVSAGAGSGKTTVMIEKIGNLLLSGEVKVSELLVVTFTVLAANEMKSRLISRLKDELQNTTDETKRAQILDMMEELKTASIDTIDGFNSKTIRKYFYELNLSPNIEIISDATRDYFITRAMKQTMDTLSRDEEKVNIMLDLYGGNRRNFERLQELILDSFYNVSNLYNIDEFLSNAIAEYVDPIKSEKIVNDYINTNLTRIKKEIIDNFSQFDKKIQDKLNNFVENLNIFSSKLTLKANLRTLQSINEISFTPKEYKENAGLKELSAKIKKLFGLINKLKENQIDDHFDEKNTEILVYFKIFIELLKNFIDNYCKLKEKNNLLDFSDLNRLMLKLTENPRILNELHSQYKYIFIDEYQDVNPLQDMLMTRLVGKDTKVFTVGDVKQSIYGFRGSSPEWFLDKYNALKKLKNDSVFDMNVNFRSNPKILNFINEIFSKIMTPDTADIDYIHDAMIDAKREDIVDDKVKILLTKEESENSVATGIYSVKNDKNTKIKTSSEALLVLKTITELIGTEFYDANTKTTRKLDYSDIAILTHSEKDLSSQALINLLKENAIPININNKLDVEASEGVKLILSILKCVNNTGDDVDFLASILALTNITIDEIIEIREKNTNFYENLLKFKENKNIFEFFSKIEEIKNNSYVLTNSELIYYILNEQKLKYYILQKKNGERELKLIDEFVARLTSIENSLNLAEFILVVESNVNKSTDFESMDKPNSVTIQTIHKSKGLEYPVVILYNSSKVFSYLGEKDEIVFNSSVGFGVDYFNVSERTKMDSLTKFAIKILNTEKGYKEEMRLLYVAMTRAKNKLFILGKYSDKMLTGEINKTNFVNMILSCFENRLNIGENIFENCEITLFDEEITATNSVDNKVTYIENKYKDFRYPNAVSDVPLKNTVTGINSQKSENEKFSTRAWLKPDMQYNQEEDRALVGTHYHEALEQLDYMADYIQNTNFEDVDYEKIKMAHDVISKLTKNAKEIKKEAEFMMYVPYSTLVESNVNDKVLVQGVVDLIIFNETSIDIVDYKFSRLPIKVLKKKYSEQLSLYKMAVEKAYNLPVEHMYIYSINTGELL